MTSVLCSQGLGVCFPLKIHQSDNVADRQTDIDCVAICLDGMVPWYPNVKERKIPWCVQDEESYDQSPIRYLHMGVCLLNGGYLDGIQRLRHGSEQEIYGHPTNMKEAY